MWISVPRDKSASPEKKSELVIGCLSSGTRVSNMQGKLQNVLYKISWHPY